MRDYQILDKLEEKVYVINDENEIQEQIKAFLDEVIARKRFDSFEGGLQAGGVIYPDKAGFKICERDGQATHAHTFETLSQYLNGETKFSGEETMGSFAARIGDANRFSAIPHNGFTVRILAGEYGMTIVFYTDCVNISLFEVNVIKEIISYVKKIISSGLMKEVKINYVTNEDKFLMSDEDDKTLDALEQIINMKTDNMTR